jgi:hypothetical protein
VASVKAADPADRTSGTLPVISGGRLEFRNATPRTLMYYANGAGLSTAMSVSGGPEWMKSIQRRLLGRLVQDRSGLTGLYNLELRFDFAAANRPDYAGPSIFTVLKEQLGLKLEAATGPFHVLVVDSASTPDEN